MHGVVYAQAGRSGPSSHGNANGVGHSNPVAYRHGRSHSVVVADGTRGRRGVVHSERYVVPGF